MSISLFPMVLKQYNTIIAIKIASGNIYSTHIIMLHSVTEFTTAFILVCQTISLTVQVTRYIAGFHN